MGRYLDLANLIDVEPLTHEVLNLVEDEDFMTELNDRACYNFWKEFLNEHCGIHEMSDLKKALDEQKINEIKSLPEYFA